jgi:intein/homing endonuclease
MKAKDFNFPATLDGTNVSVRLDDEFFKAYNNPKHPKHSLAQQVYWETVYQMLKKGEPGFSIDVGENEGETLRNAPICADTLVLTEYGYQPVKDIIGKPLEVWTGKQWAPDVVFTKTSDLGEIVQVNMTGGRSIRCDKRHPFLVERYQGKGAKRKLKSIDKVPANELEDGDILHVSLPEAVSNRKIDNNLYVLGYVYGDGTFAVNGNAEATFCTDESKKCIEPFRQHFLLSSINEEDGRGYKRAYFKVDEYWKDRSKDVFPIEVYSLSYNQAGSFLAGLFDSDGNWESTQKRLRLSSKHEGFLQNVSRLFEQYGILSHVSKAGHSTYGKAQTYQLVVASEYTQKAANFMPTIRLKPELEGYTAYRDSLVKVLSVVEDGVEPVYCADVKVEEHSFQAEGVIIGNCTEVTSYDDSDICNLASLNMARIKTLEDMEVCVKVSTAMLVAGTEYSDVPYAKVKVIREKNRRLGLGLMGLHEWLINNGKLYGPDDNLAEYMKIYERSTEFAHQYEDQWNLSKSVKTRAIAPTGTIGIVAETTTGCEPIFCVAFKRRYLNKTTWEHQYVVETVAKRLIENEGVKPEEIEDAYSIDPERRVAFQAWLQQYVDHGISSTINLPAWGTEKNNEDTVKEFGNMLMKYLPKLRGITCYPDGARSGQPLTTVSYKTAMKHEGQVFVESTDICDITKGGTCGS